MEESSNKWWILLAMCLLTAILNIDVAGINVAIPVIANEFHADLSSMQWVINIYVLMSAAFQILGGRLGDVYGHKKIYLYGAGAFILTSLGASLAFNEGSLIFFRTLQGIALGISYPITIVLTLEAFPKKQQGYAMGFIVTTMGVFLALGPILGGLFVHFSSWRWIFYINIPIGLLSFILAAMFCKSHQMQEKRSIDYLGAFLLLASLVAIIIPLNQLQNWGFSSVKFWIFLASGILLMVLLYFVSRKKDYPIFEFKLYKIRNFSLNNAIRLIVQLIFIPVLFFVPIYLQNIVGMSAFQSGLMMLLLTAAIAIGSPIAGRWVDKVGDKVPNIVAMALFTLSTFFLIFSQPSRLTALFYIALILVGIASAITFVSTVTGSLLECPENMHGIASGVLFTIAWLGCALGVAIMGSILALRGDHYLATQLAKIGLHLGPEQLEMAERVTTGVASYRELSSQFSGRFLAKITQITRASFTHGFNVAMAAYTVLGLLGIILSLWLRRHKPKSHISEPNLPI